MKLLWTATLLAMALCAPRAMAQDEAAAPAAIRIGTYDSRAVALAWGRSPGHAEALQALQREHGAGDRKQRKEAKRKGGEMQVRLHQRVFSTAGAADLLASRREQVSALAREEQVVAIVSIWELPFLSPAVERVDLTEKVVALFQPDESTLRHVREIVAQPPVPFDELSLDPRM